MPSNLSVVLSKEEREERDAVLKEKFLASYANTGSIEQSMHVLDPDGIFKDSPNSLFKRAQGLIREDNSNVQAVAEKKGLTLEKLIGVVLEGLEAVKLVKDKGGMVLKDSDGIPLFTPDHETRLKAAQIGAQIWGIPGFGKTVNNTKNVQNNLFTASDKLGSILKKK